LKKNKPTAISDILAQITQKGQLGKALEHAQIWDRWPELAGDRLAPHGHPVSIKNGRLTVAVQSPVWLHKFTFVKWRLIKKINRLLGQEVVSDIFVSLARDEDEE